MDGISHMCFNNLIRVEVGYVASAPGLSLLGLNPSGVTGHACKRFKLLLHSISRAAAVPAANTAAVRACLMTRLCRACQRYEHMGPRQPSSLHSSATSPSTAAGGLPTWHLPDGLASDWT